MDNRTKAVEAAFDQATQNRSRDSILADLKARFNLSDTEADELCTLGRLKHANRTAVPMLTEGKSPDQIAQYFTDNHLLEASEVPYLHAMLKGMSDGMSEAIHETVKGAVSQAIGGLRLGNIESDKRRLPAFLLCLFLGVLGAHRFYVGKNLTGILQLISLGGFGFWTLIDLVLILLGRFTDSLGLRIKLWT